MVEWGHDSVVVNAKFCRNCYLECLVVRVRQKSTLATEILLKGASGRSWEMSEGKGRDEREREREREKGRESKKERDKGVPTGQLRSRQNIFQGQARERG